MDKKVKMKMKMNIREGLFRYYSHKELAQLLMTELYKTKSGLNPSFIQEIFCKNVAHYNLRNNNEFVQPRVKLNLLAMGEKASVLANVTTNDTKFGIALSV